VKVLTLGEGVRRIRHYARGGVSLPCRWRLTLWFMLGAVLSIALSMYLPPVGAEAARPAETITVTLSPSSIVADGVSTSTATATLRFGGAPLTGQTVAFSSSDSGIRFGPPIDNLDGTYSATLTSSTAVGTPTIMSSSRWAARTVSGTAILTQTPGPAKSIALSLAPPSIIADGASFTTATAIVADAYGNRIPTDTVVFSSSDPRDKVTDVANSGTGMYSAVITSSTTPGQVAIQATDTTAKLSVLSELSQTAGGSMLTVVTMQWRFHYTPAYTTVLSLVVNGAPAGATVLINCRGRGCPFTKHLTVIATKERCASKVKRRCAANGPIDLTPAFQKHNLQAGTRIAVAIIRPHSIGKYYMFDMRRGRAPRVQVACLTPGVTRPGVPCSSDNLSFP
jgi:invasin-like protein